MSSVQISYTKCNIDYISSYIKHYYDYTECRIFQISIGLKLFDIFCPIYNSYI